MPASSVSRSEVAAWADKLKVELGRTPSLHLPPAQLAAEILRGLSARVPHHLADRVGPMWTSTHTRKLLGLNSRQALDSRRRNGSVLGVKATNRHVYYPLSQFRVIDAKIEVRPALTVLFKALRNLDPWTVATLLTIPAPELEGRTPLQWARAGGAVPDLATLARRVSSDGANL